MGIGVGQIWIHLDRVRHQRLRDYHVGVSCHTTISRFLKQSHKGSHPQSDVEAQLFPGIYPSPDENSYFKSDERTQHESNLQTQLFAGLYPTADEDSNI